VKAWGWGVADEASQFETYTSSCQGGLGGSDAGELDGPDTIAVNGSGHVYVTDNSNARVGEFSSSGGFVRVWGWEVADGANKFETCTSVCEGGIPGGSARQLDDPAGLGTGSSGDVYVADSHEEPIDQFTSAGAFVGASGWGADGNSAFETCTSSCQAGTEGSGPGRIRPVHGSMHWAVC
jgi:tripartite motif-containing protein 71